MQRSRTNRSSYSSTLATRSWPLKALLAALSVGNRSRDKVALNPTRQFGWAPGNTNAFNEAGGMAFHAR